MATTIELGHEECRGRVCIVCYRKASRSLSATEIKVVEEYIIEGYRVEDPDFPNGICVGCSVAVSKKRNDKDFALLIQVEDYDPKRPVGLRSLTSCSCKICHVARMSVNEYRKTKKKRGRPVTAAKTPDAPSFKICGNCFTKLYRGCNHSAESCKSSRRSKINNVENMISPTTLQRAASRTIRESSEPQAALGRPKKLKEEVRKELFTADDICGIQQDLQLSGRQVKTLTRDIRIVTGSRVALEANTMTKVSENNHRLDDFFEIQKLVYRREDKDTKLEENYEQLTVVCNNLPGLIEMILQKRERVETETLLIRIGIDGGGGFLKICMSIFDINDPFPNLKSGLSKKFKESGVKRVFLLALVPDVPENYVNVKRIWVSLSLQSLQKQFTIATDLKLCNILLGMMSHSSCHPCCWCDIDKENLNKKGKQRTIHSLMNLFWDYFDSRADKKDAKKYGNVVHPPIINNDEDNETPVIKLLPPPELHLLIGPVNTMYGGLEKIWAESDRWLKACNVQKTDYHGGSFAGNESRCLLKNVDRLQNKAPNEKVMNYVRAFRCFNDVVIACYGDKLSPDYLEKIQKFGEAYTKLKISVTPKIHAVVYHVAEFCQLTGRGLGPWSEQTGESVHHDFNKMWEKFRIKDMEKPLYGDHLLRAVAMYNSQHL